MKERVRTVLFTIVITVVFISMLAWLQGMTAGRIEKNAAVQQAKSILYAFGMLPQGIDEAELPAKATTSDIPWNETDLFQRLGSETDVLRLPITNDDLKLKAPVSPNMHDSVEIYVRYDEQGRTEALGFTMRGKGLWGSISAFAAVNPDFTRMIGIDFTDQVETPGLGARITEQEFKYYFRNLDISGLKHNTDNFVEMVRDKDVPNTLQPTHTVEAITGATQTCNGVMNMLISDLPFYYQVVTSNREIIEHFAAERGRHGSARDS